MDQETLQKKSATLFNLILAGAVVNMLSFFATTLFFAQAKEKLDASDLKNLDPILFQSEIGSLQSKAALGYGIAFLALIFCIVIALKRMKVIKLLEKAKSDALETLEF